MMVTMKMMTRMLMMAMMVGMIVASKDRDDGEAFGEDVRDENDAAAFLENTDLSQWTKQECRETLRTAMRRAWWDVSATLVEGCRDRDVSSVVYKEASNVNARLKEIKGLLRKKSTVSIAPAFQWAQSDAAVHLSVKLAHKMDTPATLGCTVTTAKFSVSPTNRSRLTFRADCAKYRKSFFLTLNMFGMLDHDTCSWEYNSVGRVTFTLPKSGPRWPRLLESNKAKPGNMHVWWDMKNRLDDEAERKRKEQAKSTKKKKDDGVEDTSTVATNNASAPKKEL